MVALARELLIALWRYLKTGTVADGAKLQPDTTNEVMRALVPDPDGLVAHMPTDVFVVGLRSFPASSWKCFLRWGFIFHHNLWVT